MAHLIGLFSFPGMLDIDSFWWPNFQTRSYWLLKNHLVSTTLAVSFISILLFAVISSIPAWLCTDWCSLSLYIPAAAAVLCIANENCQPGGWRCDAIFLIPAYAIIVVAWLCFASFTLLKNNIATEFAKGYCQENS